MPYMSFTKKLIQPATNLASETLLSLSAIHHQLDRLAWSVNAQ